MSAGALFEDEQERFLNVKPHYKDHWDLPGGVIELNESPFQGCKREIVEELSITMELIHLLCIDYMN